MKILKFPIILLLFFLHPLTALASEEIKLYPCGDVVNMTLDLEYPYVEACLDEKNNKLQKDDIIISVQFKGQKTKSLKVIYEIMKLNNAKVKIEILRNEKLENMSIKTDELRAYKFNDSLSGLGTITAIDKNGNYIGLAHSLKIGESNIHLKQGIIYLF